MVRFLQESQILADISVNICFQCTFDEKSACLGYVCNCPAEFTAGSLQPRARMQWRERYIEDRTQAAPARLAFSAARRGSSGSSLSAGRSSGSGCSAAAASPRFSCDCWLIAGDSMCSSLVFEKRTLIDRSIGDRVNEPSRSRKRRPFSGYTRQMQSKGAKPRLYG